MFRNFVENIGGRNSGIQRGWYGFCGTGFRAQRLLILDGLTTIAFSKTMHVFYATIGLILGKPHTESRWRTLLWAKKW